MLTNGNKEEQKIEKIVEQVSQANRYKVPEPRFFHNLNFCPPNLLYLSNGILIWKNGKKLEIGNDLWQYNIHEKEWRCLFSGRNAFSTTTEANIYATATKSDLHTNVVDALSTSNGKNMKRKSKSDVKHDSHIVANKTNSAIPRKIDKSAKNNSENIPQRKRHNDRNQFEIELRRRSLLIDADIDQESESGLVNNNMNLSGPKGRFGAITFVDPLAKKLYIYGGSTFRNLSSDNEGETPPNPLNIHEIADFHGKSWNVKMHRRKLKQQNFVSNTSETGEGFNLKFYSDLHQYDMKSQIWSKLKKPKSQCNWPGASCFSAAVVIATASPPKKSKLERTKDPKQATDSEKSTQALTAFMFGGYPDVFNRNLYRFSFETQKWDIVKSKNSYNVSGRWSHQIVASASSLYLVFGRDENGCLNEIQEFSLNERKWTRLVPVSDFLPEGRCGHSAVLSHNKIYVFGGILESGKKSGELLELSLKTHKWKRIQLLHEMVPRGFHTCVLLESHELLLYGGITQNDRPINGMDKIQLQRPKRTKIPNHSSSDDDSELEIWRKKFSKPTENKNLNISKKDEISDYSSSIDDEIDLSSELSDFQSWENIPISKEFSDQSKEVASKSSQKSKSPYSAYDVKENKSFEALQTANADITQESHNSIIHQSIFPIISRKKRKLNPIFQPQYKLLPSQSKANLEPTKFENQSMMLRGESLATKKENIDGKMSMEFFRPWDDFNAKQQSEIFNQNSVLLSSHETIQEREMSPPKNPTSTMQLKSAKGMTIHLNTSPTKTIQRIQPNSDSLLKRDQKMANYNHSPPKYKMDVSSHRTLFPIGDWKSIIQGTHSKPNKKHVPRHLQNSQSKNNRIYYTIQTTNRRGLDQSPDAHVDPSVLKRILEGNPVERLFDRRKTAIRKFINHADIPIRDRDLHYKKLPFLLTKQKYDTRI